MVSICADVAWSPAIRMAGSPGVSRSRKSTNSATKARTGTVESQPAKRVDRSWPDRRCRTALLAVEMQRSLLSDHILVVNVSISLSHEIDKCHQSLYSDLLNSCANPKKL